MKRLYKNDCGEKIPLEELHNILLDMLVTFSDFCEQNGIRYYLSGGTLLGAIRHKGFIPWDDDIDVNVPRPDCEKLQEISGGKIGKYYVVPPNQNTVYPCNFWRIYDYSVVIEDTRKGEGKFVYLPAFIDVFPIEGLPESDKKTKKIYNRIMINKRMIYSTKGWFHGTTLKSRIFHLFARPIATIIGKEYFRYNIQKIAKSYSFDESKYIGVVMTNVHREEEKVIKSEYIPQINVEFEGYKLKAPAGYHQYLTQLYGDYMKLPPENKRVSHHGFNLYKRINN